MSRIFLVCSFVACLLLLPAAAGGRSASPENGQADTEAVTSTVVKVRHHAVHLAQAPARHSSVSHARMADPQLLPRTTAAVPTSTSVTADDPDDPADVNDEADNDDQSDTADVDDESVNDDDADTADVEKADVEDNHADTADVEQGDKNDDHSGSANTDDGETGDD